MVYVVKGRQYCVYTVYIDAIASASVTENQMESETSIVTSFDGSITEINSTAQLLASDFKIGPGRVI